MLPQFLLVFNFYEYIADTPGSCHRLSCGDSLFTVYSCPIRDRFSDLWSHNNYIVYVAEGRKIWHTSQGTYDLQPGSCVFVRRGAAIIEQFTETDFCFYLFFVSDEFICEVLKTKSTALPASGKKYHPVITIESSEAVHSFFKSMLPYFNARHIPDQSLLQLKFKELILILADNKDNKELLSYFCALLCTPQCVSLQTVMEDNFCFNLKLEDFARLSYRSLSAFKRDFMQVYNTPPGKWLMKKRLYHARNLLTIAGKSVSDAAFESGFESSAHFSRAFSKQFGIAPSSLKKQTPALS
ncbi:MAG: helix-turn-helix domain-containing protein [Chitinophagaceae bacterium]|nr:helix-turn-helix domain-containing protein [Chitinophagaceae bacterium]